MAYLHQLFDLLLHLDVYLNQLLSLYGFWTYLILFFIIFCETGLVILPFLPGDSLLFTLGSLSAQPNAPLNYLFLLFLLILASILGNQVNFWIGRFTGNSISKSKAWFINQRHLEKTHGFYEQYGAKTIILARFIPIIRTFAPFIAGIARMKGLHFVLYNVFSAFLWIGSLLSLGYLLGAQPFVKAHFTLLIYGIILLSLLPPLIAGLGKLRLKIKILLCRLG